MTLEITKWKHLFSPPAKKFQVMLPGKNNAVMSF